MPPKSGTKFHKNSKAPKCPSATSLPHVKATYLVIVESPSKITKIKSYLGPEYDVIATCGHLCTLDKLPWKDIQYHKRFEPIYTIIDTKKAHIREMSNIIQQYPPDRIMLATDNDREGESIAYHICQIFDLSVPSTIRILFNEITQDALVKAVALQHQTRINMPLVHAQQARQVLDLMIGFKISPLLWKYVYYSKDNVLSAGRCQTPALCLIYDQDQQPDTSHYSYKTIGQFFPHPHTLSFELNHAFTQPEEIKVFMDLSTTYAHSFQVHEKKESTRSPPLPFHTSGLLQSASNVLHYSPKVTNQLAQKLYQKGYITYLRTEAKTYSQDFLSQATTFITNKYGINHVGTLSQISNQQVTLPHEAIRVTKIDKQDIDDEEDDSIKALYKLIWRNTVESCMSEAQFHTYKVTIDAPQKHTYVTTMEVPISLGWMKVQNRLYRSSYVEHILTIG